MKENEVLARFVAYKTDVVQHGYRNETYYWIKDVPLNNDDNDCHNQHSLKFDKSWSWLMPVWYKFRDLKFEDAGCHLNYKIQIVNAIVNKGPEEACKRLSEAIEWYNANKQ